MNDEQFVNSLYLNVLARDPDPAGVNGWVSYLGAGGTRDQVRAAFTNAVEVQAVVKPIIRLYEGLLDRIPDTEGLRLWADALRGGRSLNDITNDFLHSSEGVANGFGDAVNDTDFVENLYASIGRSQAQIDADPGGVNAWVTALGSMSRATVAQAFIESAENQENSNAFVTGFVVLRAHGNPQPTAAELDAFAADLDFVQGLYRNVLAREPDAAGATDWATQITGGATHTTVTATFLNSGETQTFVNPILRLYEGLLNRAPDVEGLKAWADALRGGTSLSSITDAFLHSAEAQAVGFGDAVNDADFVNALYLSIGRSQAQIDADPAGVNAWVNALSSMSRATVAQSFMESAENLQNSHGFVAGWGALRAAGNPGPTTAQLNAFSDTATIEQIIASANAVGTSTTILPTGPGATPYDLSDTAANLAAADAWLLNGATNITATDPATVEQATIIEAATNSGTNTYDISDTATNLAGSSNAVLALAGTVTASDVATATQASAIAAFAKPVVYSVSDTADNLVAASAAARNEAVNLTATGAATVAQATTIEAASNSGTTTYSISDNAANLGGASSQVLNGATNITATTPVLVALANTIQAATNGGTNTYSISDTAANLGGASSQVLNGATDITANTAVSVAVATTIEAATNSGTNTYNISDIPANLMASTNAVLALAGTVTASAAATAAEAAALAAFAKAVVYNVSDSAENLAAASSAARNEAVALSATTPATVAQATTIEAASNSGATSYNINDTGANLAGASPAVLVGATGIDVIGDAATLTDAQVTGAIIGKFDSADRLTLNAASGTTLSNLSATTLADTRVLALNAGDDSVTLTDAQVTDAIIAKFDVTDDLTLMASGTTVATLSAGTLADADVVHIDVTGDNQVALYDAGDGKITNAIIAKFDDSDRLELNADQGTTLSALSAATLGNAKVARLDAIDNQVTLTNEQVTSAIVDKFVELNDHLTLNAPGATLGALSAAVLARSNMTLNASDDAITLTAAQFEALDFGDSSVDVNDAFTITSDLGANSYNLNGAGGGAVTVVFDALTDGPDDIANFDVLTDTLQFSLGAFTGLSATGAIAADQFLVAADVSAAGGTGFTGDHRFLYNNGSGANAGDLFYDADGSGAGEAVLIATMQTVPGLTADDIIMIA